MSDHLADLPDLLEALSDATLARRQRKQTQTLRGIRGVSMSEVARLSAAAWEEDPCHPDRDASDLSELFGTAWEDGLVAIGLLAAGLPDAPEAALQLGLEWVERVDDVITADALGWLVLGPGALATGADWFTVFEPVRSHRRDAIRRAGVAAAMAATPTPVEGPAAAALRSRLKAAEVRCVEAPINPLLHAVADQSWRDEGVAVRKALRRMLRAWGTADHEALSDWAEGVRGGLPKMLREEVRKAVSRARRRALRTS